MANQQWLTNTVIDYYQSDWVSFFIMGSIKKNLLRSIHSIVIRLFPQGLFRRPLIDLMKRKHFSSLFQRAKQCEKREKLFNKRQLLTRAQSSPVLVSLFGSIITNKRAYWHRTHLPLCWCPSHKPNPIVIYLPIISSGGGYLFRTNLKPLFRFNHCRSVSLEASSCVSLCLPHCTGGVDTIHRGVVSISLVRDPCESPLRKSR